MIINYLGGGSFKLQSGQMSLLIDPENNRFKADIVLRTIIPGNFAVNSGVSSEAEIAFPGEYEVKNIEILGIGLREESTEKFLKTAYLVRWEDIKLVFLGHASRTLDADTIEKLDEPDILFLPVGGGHFLFADEAAKLAKKIGPAFIVPSFFKSADDFLKAMGQKAEAEEKLVFKKKDLEGAKNKVVVLKT